MKREGGTARVERPRFTIVTASYNQGRYLTETIESVCDQGRADVEHIVIDGGSTDGSVDILRQYDGVLSYWVSEKDAGQSSAWNAGVRRARGDFVAFLNSDDLFVRGGIDAMARLADRHPAAEWLVGGTQYFGVGSGELSHPGAAPKCASDVLFFATYAPQPGHFFGRAMLERVGPLDETMHFSFDLDLMVRCALDGAETAATDEIVAAFRYHEASKTVTMQDVQRANTAVVEARYWPEIERREGAHARRVRAHHKGYLALERVREVNAGGQKPAAWALLRETVRLYPSMLATRAFVGTVQRLLGLRY